MRENIIDIKSEEVPMIDAMVASHLLILLAMKCNNREVLNVAYRINLYNYCAIHKNHSNKDMEDIISSITNYGMDIISLTDEEKEKFESEIFSFIKMLKKDAPDDKEELGIKPSIEYL